MDIKTRNLIIVGIVICVVIACLSPFLASSDPDGLEKSAEDSKVPESLEGSTFSFQSPMPDYTLGDTSIGEIAALIIGVIVTLLLAYGVAFVLRKN
ncbi:PDGLE domain-containing protein [uncultured Methanobrevibacter sp.]|uniref:PDGLE domain-containing protein n=1 Tax=uncultured Methanobrevibacter sp. TaxID=253161 RepID=UPI0025F03779|nr:PDGLE domain-containing protein [uncultured Methanobrevibacter sp.]